MPLSNEQILDAVRQCYDPEIPVNIVDLGLIYDIQHDEAGNVSVKMTLTSQGCPSALQIPEQVKQRISALADVHDVKVQIVWEPAWSPTMFSEAARKKLGIDV